jgi:hypothetical protein
MHFLPKWLALIAYCHCEPGSRRHHGAGMDTSISPPDAQRAILGDKVAHFLWILLG